jgi:hypothetical protein
VRLRPRIRTDLKPPPRQPVRSCVGFLAGNWPERAPNAPFLPDIPVANCLKVIPAALEAPWHGRGRRFGRDQFHQILPTSNARRGESQLWHDFELVVPLPISKLSPSADLFLPRDLELDPGPTANPEKRKIEGSDKSSASENMLPAYRLRCI